MRKVMKTERVVLSFIAILIGLLVAGGGFYLWQSTKTIEPTNTGRITKTAPTPTLASSIFLTVEEPVDEQVSDKRTISLSGKTIPEATIVISTATIDEVVTPTKTGTYSTTVILKDGANVIEITAIAPNGEEKKVIRTVTYSTESF